MSKTSENEAIARTVEQLIMWGFSGRGEVFEAVGFAARTVFHRTFADGNTALGGDRIEQIWEQYRPKGFERFFPEGDYPWVKKSNPKKRWRYTKAGLRRLVPDSTATIQELAEALLHNGGTWRWPTEMVWHPLEGKWEESEISCPGRGEPELSLRGEEEQALMQALMPKARSRKVG